MRYQHPARVRAFLCCTRGSSRETRFDPRSHHLLRQWLERSTLKRRLSRSLRRDRSIPRKRREEGAGGQPQVNGPTNRFLHLSRNRPLVHGDRPPRRVQCASRAARMAADNGLSPRAPPSLTGIRCAASPPSSSQSGSRPSTSCTCTVRRVNTARWILTAAADRLAQDGGHSARSTMMRSQAADCRRCPRTRS